MDPITSHFRTLEVDTQEQIFFIRLLFSIEEAAVLDAEEFSSAAHCGPLQDHMYVPSVSGDSLL